MIYRFNPSQDVRLSVPIGKPAKNMRIYLLDARHQAEPIGVAGELCIAGAGLARGYLNRPELTAEKFVDNPFEPGTKMYKTGDLARWLPDGKLEYLGRIDHQVKIRGYRIELGEIESQLLGYESVNEAVVVAQEDAGGDKVLCAYYVMQEPVEAGELRAHLAATLPAYMVPTFFMPLAEMPLTSNGKLDRKALPKPDASLGLARAYEAPATELEKRIVGIWQALLGVDEVGVTDNFFEIGGHSLRAMVLVSRMEREFGVAVPLRELFRWPTVRTLAEWIEALGEVTEYARIEPLAKQDDYEMSSAQQRMYVLQQMEPQSTAYNMPAVLVLEGALDGSRLERAFHELMVRHESLRTRFVLQDGVAVQKVQEAAAFDPEASKEERLFTLEYREGTEQEAKAWARDFVRPFTLSEAPLLRVELLKLSEEHHLLAMDMHHIISDGVSVGILMQELGALYNGEALVPLRIQYKDYAAWQHARMEQEAHRKQEAYWLEQLSGELPVLQLPTDHPRPQVKQDAGDVVEVRAGAELTEKLQVLAQETGATPYMVLLAAYQVLLARYSGQDDIIVGSPVAGRTHADLDGVVGMFVNTLAMRGYPSGDKTFLNYLEEVKETALGAYEHQEVPFEALVEKLQVPRDVSRNAVFDVMFVLQNTEVSGMELEGVTLGAYEEAHRVAKFDLTLEAHEQEGGILVLMGIQYRAVRTGNHRTLDGTFYPVA